MVKNAFNLEISAVGHSGYTDLLSVYSSTCIA